MKNRCQRNILPWIVQNPQKIQDHLYLHGTEISCLCLGVRRNPHLGKHLNILVRNSGRTSQKHHNIPVTHRPVISFIVNK